MAEFIIIIFLLLIIFGLAAGWRKSEKDHVLLFDIVNAALECMDGELMVYKELMTRKHARNTWFIIKDKKVYQISNIILEESTSSDEPSTLHVEAVFSQYLTDKWEDDDDE